MILTSIGFHTFMIYLRLTIEEAQTLIDIFLKSSNFYLDEEESTTHGLEKYYDFKYRSKYKGLSWTVRLNYSSDTYTHGNTVSENEEKPCSIRATINPKPLCGIKNYITAANVSYLCEVIERFNSECGKISPILKDFNTYSLNRNDYCINFDLVELEFNCTVEQMMKLIKQANIPKHFEERTDYYKESKAHRKTTDPNSFYLENKSVTINCYCKHPQLKKEFEECPNIDDSLNIIRFEVQCKYLKVYHLLKRIKDVTKLPDIMHQMLSDEYSEMIIRHYFYKTVRRGDYYTLDGAKERIKHQNYHKNKEDRLTNTLELVNQSRGIWKAKSKLNPREREIFNQSLKDLDHLRINPVTIPREWNIKYIPNLMTAYYDKTNADRLQADMEKFNQELHLIESQNHGKKRGKKK